MWSNNPHQRGQPERLQTSAGEGFADAFITSRTSRDGSTRTSPRCGQHDRGQTGAGLRRLDFIRVDACWGPGVWAFDGFRFRSGIASSRGENIAACWISRPCSRRSKADPELSDLKLVSETLWTAALYRLSDFPAKRMGTGTAASATICVASGKGDTTAGGLIGRATEGGAPILLNGGRPAAVGRGHHLSIHRHDGFNLADLVSYNGKHQPGQWRGQNRDGDNQQQQLESHEGGRPLQRSTHPTALRNRQAAQSPWPPCCSPGGARCC